MKTLRAVPIVLATVAILTMVGMSVTMPNEDMAATHDRITTAFEDEAIGNLLTIQEEPPIQEPLKEVMEAKSESVEGEVSANDYIDTPIQSPDPVWRGSVTQGDRIAIYSVTDGWHGCTLGYANPETRVGYTAAHCEGQNFGVGSEVHVNGVAVGVMTPLPAYSEYGDQDDIARIDFYDDIEIIGNIYSGDHIVSRDQIRLGMQTCSYGSTTSSIVCAPVMDYTDGPDTFGTGFPVLRGDSGGPVWLTDANGNSLGLAGLHHGIMENENGMAYGCIDTYADLAF